VRLCINVEIIGSQKKKEKFLFLLFCRLLNKHKDGNPNSCSTTIEPDGSLHEMLCICMYFFFLFVSSMNLLWLYNGLTQLPKKYGNFISFSDEPNKKNANPALYGTSRKK
jgi:hypothetical protein